MRKFDKAVTGIVESRMGKWMRSKEEGRGKGEEGVSSSEKEVGEKEKRDQRRAENHFPCTVTRVTTLQGGGGGVRACIVCIKANVQAVKTDVHYL
jgi:hypothetical protein